MTIDERLANTLFPLPAIREINQAKHETGISLGLGELKTFKVDQKIIDALTQSLNKSGTSYTHNGGLPELRSAIANSYNQALNLDLNNTVITIGVQNAIYSTIKTLAKLGAKRVLIPEIHFGIYKKIPAEFGLNIETYKLTNDFGIDFIALEKQLLNDDIIIINSPANPTGRVLANTELQQLSNILNKKLSQGYVISDEIYSKLIYEGEKPKSLIEYFNRTIVVDGISKSGAVAGLRVGWIVTQNSKLAQAIISNNATIISSPPTANQYAALPVVLGTTKTTINEYNTTLKQNCDAVCKALDELGIQYNRPTGSFYIFPNLKSILGNNTKAFCIKAAKSINGVVVIPGTAFGASEYIRISLATSEINEALKRLKSLISNEINN